MKSNPFPQFPHQEHEDMETLHPGMMHHNPYEMVKNEPIDSPPKIIDSSRKLYPTPDMLLGVTNFSLQPTFAPPHNNNNHDHLNNNHPRSQNSSNGKGEKALSRSKPHSESFEGRSLAADRKRPYPCNICPSRFGSKMELEEHQNSHTGMKPFECDVCKARFNRRSTLWNHKRIHSDAKPFVCTVCQMTFKWKNSLKCHKEMHQRKNESSGHMDNDLRQLTYATAAKKKLLESQGEDLNGNPATSLAASVHSQPLITTTTPKKKNNKVRPLYTTDGKISTMSNGLSTLHLNSLAQQPLQASALIPPSDHHLELDTSQLDSLVNNNHSNMLLHLYGDMDGSLAPRHATSMLTGLDDNGMLTGQILSDGKADSPMGGAPAPINIHMPINILQYRPVTQLPSVHHLTSTSVGMDYTSSDSSNIAQPQYIVTTPSEMMLPQGLGYPQPLDQCVILATGQDYMPNFDYNMLQHYQLAPQEPEPRQMQPPPQQQNAQPGDEEKVVPYEQW